MAVAAPSNAGKTFPVEILTPDEVNALLRACSRRPPTGLRNRALLTLLYRGGLRVSVALALYPKDVDADAGTVTVLHGKGDKRRTVGLDPAAFAVLEQWIARRATLRLNGRQPLLCTLDGAPVKDAYVRALLPRPCSTFSSPPASKEAAPPTTPRSPRRRRPRSGPGCDQEDVATFTTWEGGRATTRAAPFAICPEGWSGGVGDLRGCAVEARPATRAVRMNVPRLPVDDDRRAVGELLPLIPVAGVIRRRVAHGEHTLFLEGPKDDLVQTHRILHSARPQPRWVKARRARRDAGISVARIARTGPRFNLPARREHSQRRAPAYPRMTLPSLRAGTLPQR